MTAYAFNVTSGDWNVSTNWTPNGVPGASDTVSFSGAARKVFVPSGYTAQVLGMTFSGSNTSNRGEVEINGTLELYGDVTQSTWTTLNINGGILDVRSYYWFVSQADGTGKRAEVLGSNGGKIISSTTIGGFTGPSGATGDPGTGALSLEDFHIENVHFRYGSAWYPGNKFVIDNVSFYNCGIVQHEPYIDDAADWIVRAVTFVGTQASGDYKCYLSCRDKGGTITGQRIFENVVWDYSSASGTRLIRLRWFPAVMAPTGLYVYRAYIEGGLFYPTVEKMFACPSTTVVGEAIAGVTNSYFFIDRDNPHTLQGMCENVSESVIEATYGAGYTDAGDHFVLATSGTFVIEYNLIIDSTGGACMNALNSTFNGSYTFRHNTYVADVEDDVYGQWCRTENFGEFSTGATLNIHSNISYARSNPSGASNIRVLNIEEPGDDQVDLMDNNCVYGMGSTLTTLFSGVTSATKGSYGSQTGWGLNDLIGTNPQFVDDTRGLMSWGATLSLSDQDDVIKELIYGVNGYDGSTHTQTGTTTLELDDLLDHVRAGFAPTNSALQNAGYDSITIGAIEYQSSGYTITADSGSFTLTGQAASLLSGKKLLADTQGFALTGQNAGLLTTRILTAETQSYALAGQDTGLFFGRKIAADSGSFSLAGQDSSLIYARRLTAETASYALAGQDVTLTYTPVGGYTLAAESAAYTLTGQDAALRAARKLSADTQGYSLSGQDASLLFGRLLSVDSGAFALDGQDASLMAFRRLAADSRSYALTGQDVQLIPPFSVPVEFFPYVTISIDRDYLVAIDKDFCVKVDNDANVEVTHGV